MYKFGLKVWSINEQYIHDAVKYYEQGLYSYIEVYAVPGSYDRYVSMWAALKIPFVIHAPHFVHGLNLSKKECELDNQKILQESLRWADALDASFVVVHPGIGGDSEQTAEQLKKFFDKRILIENKPYHVLPAFAGNQICVGYSPEQIAEVMMVSGVGFCLDAGHALCAANALGEDPYAYLEQFNKLKPAMYHLTDGDQQGIYDVHWHFGKGTFDLKKIFSLYPLGSMISLETEKNFQDNLADFKDDISYLKKNIIASNLKLDIRLATKSDCKEVYDLSNDPVVRVNSFNQDFIVWEDHVAWFEKKIANADVCFYVVRDQLQRLVAYVRFEKQDTEQWIISFALSSLFRGWHLAARIIREATALVSRNASVKKIIARIKKENEPSIKSFLNVGYVGEDHFYGQPGNVTLVYTVQGKEQCIQ